MGNRHHGAHNLRLSVAIALTDNNVSLPAILDILASDISLYHAISGNKYEIPHRLFFGSALLQIISFTINTMDFL